jgi:hypothetical protein
MMIEVLDLADIPVNAGLQAVIDRYNNTPVDELTRTQQAFSSLRYGVKGVIAQPEGAAPVEEADQVLLIPGAFAYRLKVPSISTQFLADLHGVPVLAVTSPIPSWHFGPTDRSALWEGRFDPYSEQYQKYLSHRVPHVGRIAVAGGSMGATIGMNFGARASNHFDISSVKVGDPPNSMERTALELGTDFGKDGFDEVSRHIANSGIRSLASSRRTERRLAEQRDLARYVGSMLSHASANLLAGIGMTRSTFEQDLCIVESRNIPAVVAYGQDSTIARAGVMRAMAQRGGDSTTRWVEVRDSGGKAGHTWLDDLKAWATITQIAS